jgi:hypothetical protein
MAPGIARERGGPAVATAGHAPVTEGEYQPGAAVSALSADRRFRTIFCFVGGAGGRVQISHDMCC